MKKKHQNQAQKKVILKKDKIEQQTPLIGSEKDNEKVNFDSSKRQIQGLASISTISKSKITKKR